ncbi:hypothetical protein CEXT_775111 [Caerostris extrusa]|uniref:Uncharacterized protein n=1 Tax=Caerostris extrusa TaxID=172846 RepID=A0AAV4N719_CAEEX|nr:hypothetical protein CEXT_775111 [Caerostris extrusa]
MPQSALRITRVSSLLAILCAIVQELAVLPIMHKYGFVWPERMNCDDFPRYGDQEHLCMDAKEGAGPENGEYNTKQETKPVRKPPSYRGRNPKGRDRHESIPSEEKLVFHQVL